MSRILDIVDMQGDFITGVLAVPGADKLVDKANAFFRALPAEAFDAVVFKYDTHFADEYRRSPEFLDFGFPLHCPYGKSGWQLTVDPSLLTGKADTYFMTKNTFDMWGKNPLPDNEAVTFESMDEKQAYANLRHMTRDPQALQPGILRDSFIAALKAGKPLEVILFGVASNFCDDDAIFGYLQNGAQVTVLEDLVAGLVTTAPGRAVSGDIRDVIALPKYKSYVDNGKLHLTTSTQFLQNLKP